MDIRKQKNSIPTVSLDEPLNEDESMSLMDIIPSEFNIDEYLIKKEQIEKLLKAVMTLDKYEQKLLKLYYGVELSQQEIAAELNVSQAKISRNIKTIIEKLRIIMINE
jgi:RNA polymerase sigma factor for flagellar operon FliA